MTPAQGNAFPLIHMRSSISLAKAVRKAVHVSFPQQDLLDLAYGVVYRARDRQSARVVALKQVRISAEERQNGVPITALREISILRSLKHNNIIDVVDVAVGAHAMEEVYMVMEYAEQVGSPMPR